MKNYTLTKEQVASVASKLRESGYEDYNTTGYTRFTKKRGDSVFFSHSLNIIRATKDTLGHDIITAFFGVPNGKAPEGEINRNSSWFFNGYTGRSGTDIGWYQTKDITPEIFEFRIGGFGGECYSIEFDGRNLIYIPSFSWGAGFSDQLVEINPSHSDWKRFWKKVESLGVWNWKKRYDNHDICDGTQWELKLKVKGKGRAKSIYGSNEYPEKFDAFLKAISSLVGGLPVR